jgi:hypothetical protein
METYKNFLNKVLGYLNEEEMLQLAKSEYIYRLEINGEPVPSDGVIEMDTNSFDVFLSQEQPGYLILPREILQKGAISGDYFDHLTIKGVTPKNISRGDGTVITSSTYEFENLPSNTSLILEVSDELKE